MTSRGSHSQRADHSNQMYSNLIYNSEIFLSKLREFKPQSLGSLEARRKSSSTLIFPIPPQACLGQAKCPRYPHGVKPTLGYWIECHGPGSQSKLSSSGAAFACGAAVGSAATSKADSTVVDALGNVLNLEGQQDYANECGDFKRLDIMRRRQSIDSCSSDLGLQKHPTYSPRADSLSEAENSLARTPDQLTDINKPSSSRTGDLAIAQGRPGHLAGSVGETLDDSGQLARRTSSSRQSHNKRMMTRDDIDLHMPRKGMPNITVTEPSFNQSIVMFNNSGGRQSGQSGDSKRSADTCGQPDSKGDSRLGQAQPEARGSQTEQCEQLGGLDESELSFVCKSSYSAEADNDSSGCDDTTNSPQQTLLRHHYHRPSVIREDSQDQADAPVTQQLDIAGDIGESYCGLSATSFHKQSYQQSGQQQAFGHQHGYQQPSSWDRFRDGPLELISFEEENYEKYYYGTEHWNYFTNDELLGPVMLSLKQEVNNQRDHFHVLLRTVSYTLHGTIPASTICADRYDREAIVRELSEIAKLKPPLMLGQLPSTPDELLKLDHIFIKTELKVGVIYIRDGQSESEEAILGNKHETELFAEFLDLLGDRITLKGFDRYKGGLDTVHNLTGTESVYTMWRNIEIMFHVSTMLPHEENDPQKLQKKRHIGNDIVCVAFIESDDTLFWPGCIKSYFLHTFITVQTSPKPLKEGERRKYSVSCVCRNEVQYAFKPYLVERNEFYKSDLFREWLLVKIVNGERASYSAPKFARMQDRTRSQMLEDIITNLMNHLMTGQIPKPYRRGSWRPLGHTRASSPLEDSMKDYFEDYDQLARDFCQAFCGPSKSMLCDVVFRVKDHRDDSYKLVHGVRAIMAIRSRTFLEMLYGFVPPGTGQSSLQTQTNLRTIEMKALSGDFGSTGSAGKSPGGGDFAVGAKSTTGQLLAKRGSVGADPSRKIEEKDRRQSMLPNLSKSLSQKPNYLTVPSSSGANPTASTGGMIKNALNRLVSGNWSGWSGNIKGYKGEHMHIKVDQNKAKVDLTSLAICKEIAKIDAEKLSQREFEIKEFDYETFQQTIEYIHNGQCRLSYETIPGLICAAEHYDLPDLVHACFHHANNYMRLTAAPKMMNALYQNSCFYMTAMQLLDSIYEFVDPQGQEFLSRQEYLELDESVLTALLSRKTLQVSELRKFQAMDRWTRHQLSLRHQQRRLKKQASLPRQKSLESQQAQLQHQQQGRQVLAQTGERRNSLSSVHELEQHDKMKAKESKDCATNRLMASEEPNEGSSEKQLMDFDAAEFENDYRVLMCRLNKEVSIKLEKISNEDLVKIVLPAKVFSNQKIFEVMADESRIEY